MLKDTNRNKCRIKDKSIKIQLVILQVLYNQLMKYIVMIPTIPNNKAICMVKNLKVLQCNMIMIKLKKIMNYKLLKYKKTMMKKWKRNYNK